MVNMIQGATPRESVNIYSRLLNKLHVSWNCWNIMFWNIVNLVSFIINLLECLVIYSCSVTVLDNIVISLEKKHMTEQNNICFCRKSSNQIACLHQVRHDPAKQHMLCWCYHNVYVVVILTDPQCSRHWGRSLNESITLD